jgi:hypothetical protein
MGRRRFRSYKCPRLYYVAGGLDLAVCGVVMDILIISDYKTTKSNPGSGISVFNEILQACEYAKRVDAKELLGGFDSIAADRNWL